MTQVTHSLVVLVMTFALWPVAPLARQNATQDPALQVPGPPYDVPEMKVYLTDEDTKEPFANKEVMVEYFWGWKILKHTPEADRMEILKDIIIKARTDGDGLVIIPARLIMPSRPQAPEGAEFSEPTFQFVEIEVQDTRHNCGLVFDKKDIDKYRGGAFLDFRRVVPIWRRPTPRPTASPDANRQGAS